MNLATFAVSSVLFALIASTLCTANPLNVVSQDNIPSAPLPETGAAVDEVVVESSLYIKPKANSRPLVRRVRRSTLLNSPIESASLVEHKRIKRFPQEYGQSQAAANAAANSHKNGPFGFGSSASNAGAQAFNAYGPSGSFGASSAGTVSQALNSNKFGTQNSAGASMSQAFILPNGQTINFASTNSFANTPFGNNANSRGAAVSVSQG